MGEQHDRPMLKIGELARRLDLNARTLRYYESIGLLPPPTRTAGSYRLYSEEDEQRLRFVLQAKRMGFSLDEIRSIIQLSRQGAPCAYVLETLARHLAGLDDRISTLQQLREELAATAIVWQERGETSDGQVCGLIEQWTLSPRVTDHEETMTKQKRKVEVFTAGCPICEPAVELVQRIACPSCDVTVYNVKDDPQAAQRAKAASVSRLPMVLVEGKPLECCRIGPVTEAALRAAGVGRP